MVFLLPITSLPLVVRLVRSDVVGAPSGIILLFLIFIWFIPYLLKRGKISAIGLFSLIFAASAVVSSLLSLFLPIPPFRDVSILTNSAKALITLAIGLSFYLVFSVWCCQADKLRLVLRLIHWSGLIVMLWSIMQAIAWRQLQGYPAWMEVIHRTISTGVLYKGRVCGLSLEPSWLAHQLNMLYLPIWLAFSVRRESVYRFRFLRIFSLENVLLAGGTIVMLLTFSRVGWLAFLLMIAYLLWLLGGWCVRLMEKFIKSIWLQRESNRKRSGMVRTLAVLSVIAGIAIFMIILVTGIVFAFYKFDPRMADMFLFQPDRENPLMWYAEQLEFGPRLIYWMAGWGVFEAFPWLGVGLGNVGFFLPDYIAPYGWRFAEVRTLLFQTDQIINSKNLWVRILSETGLVGFVIFLIWLFLLWKAGGFLRGLPKNKFPFWGTIGLSGELTILGLLIEGFSVDSFALPYFWVSLGLLTAAFTAVQKEISLPADENK